MIVCMPSLGVEENLPCLLNFLENGIGSGVVLSAVIELPIQPLVGSDDRLLGGVALNTKDVVVVPGGTWVGSGPDPPLKIEPAYILLTTGPGPWLRGRSSGTRCVIFRPQSRIHEYLVSSIDLVEPLLRVGVRVHVGMVFAGELAKCPANIIHRGRWIDTQYGIVVVQSGQSIRRRLLAVLRGSSRHDTICPEVTAAKPHHRKRNTVS